MFQRHVKQELNASIWGDMNRLCISQAHQRNQEKLTEHLGNVCELLTHIVWNTKHWFKCDAIFVFPTHWAKTSVFILSARPCTWFTLPLEMWRSVHVIATNSMKNSTWPEQMKITGSTRNFPGAAEPEVYLCVQTFLPVGFILNNVISTTLFI